MNKNNQANKGGLYDIGSVARLTGLSSPNIRVWEKRYNVVEPGRTDTGRRLYTSEDVQKLTLLKSLIDRGGQISVIAPLTIPQLEERLRKEIQAQSDTINSAPDSDKPRAIVTGATVNELLGDIKATEIGLTSLLRFESLEELLAQEKLPNTDLIIVEAKSLFEDDVKALQRLIRQLGANRGIIIYRYSPSKARRRLDKDIDYITALRAPIGMDELEIICRAEVRLALDPDRAEAATGAVAPRIFSDQQIAKISHMQTAIECECPQHLSSVISSLVGFEDYSAECVSRSPEDEALHRYLFEETARARKIMEEALQHTLKAEGLEV